MEEGTCGFQTFLGDESDPPEWCANPVEDGQELCEAHGGGGSWPDAANDPWGEL